jgi:hypothetical protein
MRYLGLVVIVFFAFGRNTFAGKICDLSEVMRPTQIVIAGDSLIVCCQKSIRMYSLTEKKFIRFIGQLGQGPGEFEEEPKVYFKPPAQLLVKSGTRIMTFSTRGDLVHERRIPFMAASLKPFAENYAASVFNFTQKDRKYLYITALYDSQFRLIKELHRYVLPNPRKRIEVVYFKHDFCVYGDKIFVSKPEPGKGGLGFDVFDKSGNKLYSIHKNFARTRIPGDYISRKIAEIREEKKAFWHLLKDTLYFPEYYPAMRDFTISDDNIYIKTWVVKRDAAEFMVMDLKGNVLKRVYLPEAQQLYTIKNHTYYYLKENTAEEIWQLHSLSLK